ncbi:MAG: PAS domain-containing sensor histidine kinase [Verrucomicrobia bacterium]|nr:PAS domain-containing sensor histidine kinase [Verrucomicrobiota bacterium]
MDDPANRPISARCRLSHESIIQLFALIGGLPAVAICLFLVWSGDATKAVQWTCSVTIVGIWLGCVLALRKRVVYPMQTLTNLLAALREGDYTLRSPRARQTGALGEVMREINALGETLLVGRQKATEAGALLRAAMAEIDVAVFTFDDIGRLQLINRAGMALLDEPEDKVLGCHAKEIGLAECLEGDAFRTFTHQFPGWSGTRWGLRRTGFREGGHPHQLLVLTDLSRALREEERAAWQRLVRVLGHELNNSLTPIRSIAQSIATLMRRPESLRSTDWQEDVENGLAVIANRAEALSRFMDGYARLARLPEPRRQRQNLDSLIRQAAALELRLAVAIHPPLDEILLDLDGDQIEQILINLIRNAADSALGTRGGVQVSWNRNELFVEVRVEDEGSGLADTANLFVPFFTTKPQGSGIGLVLSRQIAEAHGGSLKLENRPNGKAGCCATLRLPIETL